MSTDHLSNAANEFVSEDAGAGTEVSGSTPGQRLSNERVAHRLSQKEVADKLHITIHYVNAIEHDAYEKLPGAVFAKGYIKSYAELLGLDVQDYLNCFEEFQAQLRSGAEEQENRKRRATGKRNLNIAFASVFLFVGVFVAVWYFNGSEDLDSVTVAGGAESITESDPRSNISEPAVPAEIQIEDQRDLASSSSQLADNISVIPATPETTLLDREVDASDAEVAEETMLTTADSTEEFDQEESQPQAISTPVALIEQAVTPDESLRVITITEDGEDILRISFSGESWVEVNDGSANQVYRDLLEAGDVLQITGEAPFNILLGDAPFTQLTFNGDEIDVSENIRIDNSARLTVGL